MFGFSHTVYFDSTLLVCSLLCLFRVCVCNAVQRSIAEGGGRIEGYVGGSGFASVGGCAGMTKPAVEKGKRGKAPVGVHSAGPTSLSNQVGSSAGGGRKADGGRKGEADWVSVKIKNKEAPSAPADTLVAEGWSVPVLPCTDALTNISTGIVLANMKLGRELIGVLSADAPLALLLPAPVAGKESQVILQSVLVQTKMGRCNFGSDTCISSGRLLCILCQRPPLSELFQIQSRL